MAMADTDTLGDRLLKALGDAVDKITTLNVTTLVGNIPSDKTAIEDLVTTQGAKLEIDMVLGNAKESYTAGFAESAAYMKLHTDLVATARAVRVETIGLVKEAALALAAIRSPTPAAAPAPIAQNPK
jgi:hypothetical protein